MNVLLISPWGYHDVLTQSYVLPYIPHILQALNAPANSIHLYLITVERSPNNLSAPVVFASEASSRFFHVPIVFSGPSLIGYITIVLALIRSSRLALSRKFFVIHSWCATGGAIGSILAFLSGSKLVLDSFEPHADPMVETGCWARRGFKYFILRRLEVFQSRIASAYLPVSKYMYDYSLFNYGVNISGRSALKPACVDVAPYSYKSNSSEYSSSIHGIYVGKLGGLYLDVDFFRILKAAQAHWGQNLIFTILSCQSIEIIEAIALRSSFDLSTIHISCVSHARVTDYLQKADFAITALKPVPSRLCCTPIKTGEYWSAGLPILTTSSISVDSELIQREKIGVVLDDLTDECIATSILSLDALVKSNSSNGALSARIRNIAIRERGFHLATRAYETIYKSDLLFA